MQNNGKEMYKKVCCTSKVVFLLIRKKVCYTCKVVFLLIRKKVCCTCKVVVVVVFFFLLIRSITAVFYRSRCFHPVFDITRFYIYIFFEETINITESFAFSPGQIYILSLLHNLPNKHAFKLFAYLIIILIYRFSQG